MYRAPDALDELTPAERSALAGHARALRDAARCGRLQPVLQGRNLALLSDAPDSEAAQRFVRAASELGARVARIRPDLSRLPAETDVLAMAQLLGRLYDAVECQGLPPELVHTLRGAAGVPVFDTLGGADAASEALLALLDDELRDGDNRRCLLQALLVRSIA